MLEQFFLHIAEISIQASVLILAIILLRLCFKNISKQIICTFWMLAAIRLILPFQITSPFSLVPDTSAVQNLSRITYSSEDSLPTDAFNDTDAIFTDISINISDTISTEILLPEDPPVTPQIPAAVNDIQEVSVSYSLSEILAVVWLIVAAAFILYGVISYLRTKHTLNEAVYDRENIWYSDRISSPFVLGYRKPRIYIPYSTASAQLPYIIAHEQAHISHLDHIGKLAGFLLLCIYWFNPFVWIAYLLYCRDLELACDERVLAKLGTDRKKFYSSVLLDCSVTNKAFLQSPLAFGEIAVKERIIHILNYKKPSFWIIALTLLLAIIYCICFMTNTASDDMQPPNNTTQKVNEYYLNTDDILEVTENYWLTRLEQEGKLPSNKNLYYYTPFEQAFTNLNHNKMTEVICYYYTLDEHRIYSLYRTIVTITKKNNDYHVTQYVHTPLDSITTATGARATLVLYGMYGLDDSQNPDKTLGECVHDCFVKDYVDSIAPPENEAVATPARALETLMHISGGTAETFPGENDNYKYVLYTFSDKTQAVYYMKRAYDNGYWYPVELVPVTEAENARRTESFILQATIDMLKPVSQEYSIQDYQAQMPEKVSSEAFRILDSIPEKDITLYTLLDGSAMILRDGDALYPIFLRCVSAGRLYLPQIYKADYDNDGIEEYALHTLYMTGTDCELMMLSMLEPDNGSLRIQSFSYPDIWNQLNQQISYEYVGETLNISTYKNNALLNVSYWNEKFNTTYNQLHYGDWIWFVERDGQWWIIVNADVKEEASVSALSQCGAVFAAPVNYFSDKYFEIGNLYIELVDDRSLFSDDSDSNDDTDYSDQITDFPGKVKLLEDGSLISEISLQDHECAIATKSDTKEQVYHWMKNSEGSFIKTYPLEVVDGVLQDVPAKVITEEDILKYPFGQSLLQTVRMIHPYGIKQYILRDNGTLHVNVGYEDDRKTFLTLEHLTFELSDDMFSASLTDSGIGYYLLGINNPESLNVFRKDFTGNGHFLPDDTSQLPWKWLLELNEETIYDTTISVEDIPVIAHTRNYYFYTSMNVSNLSNYSTAKGFTFAEIWNNGKAFTEMRYLTAEDDLIIIFDDTDTVVSFTYNGEAKSIPDDFIEFPYYFYYSSSPAMIDVDGDGQKEFVDTWWTRGTGYLEESCEVYRLDTPDLEKIPFDTDITEIINKIEFEVIDYQEYEHEFGTFTFTLSYEDQVGMGVNRISIETLQKLTKDGNALQNLTEAIYNMGDPVPGIVKTEHIMLNNDTFQMGDIIYGFSLGGAYLGEITADYIYDKALNRFVIDMETVKLEVFSQEDLPKPNPF